MNRIQSVGLWGICLMCGATSLHAQEMGRRQEVKLEQVSDEKLPPHEIPSPEKEAKKLTDRMKQELRLTDKQYKKLYKLNLKEQKKRFSALFNAPHPPMGPGMGGPRPPMGEGGMPSHRGAPDMPPPMHGNGMQDMEKFRASQEKKIKKILTEEQYQKWQTLRLPHSSRRDSL